MGSKLNRRDFLKLAGALPLGLSAAQLASPFRLQTDGRKNVIVIVFDAWSAYNMSLYGYARDTTPNLNKLVDRATVYHNHYAGSNYTTPGTATLLTGTLPWTNRAMQPNGDVAKKYARNNLFSTFKDRYRIAYTHNEWANTLLTQLSESIEELPPRYSLFLPSSDSVVQKIFRHDKDISAVGWARSEKIASEKYAYSLFFSRLIALIDRQMGAQYFPRFPRGLPASSESDGRFILDHAIDWIAERVTAIHEPLCGYFHLLPPHSLYNTTHEFAGRFKDDGYQPIQKPRDMFIPEALEDLDEQRAHYDEYILYVDSEFNRLMKIFEEAGILENSWIVLTSDHGEAFERGIYGHKNTTLYQPLIRVPLVIFEPGQSARRDVYAPTSATDLVPTLAFLNDLPIPDWTEGQVLPPYAQPDENRSIYAMRAHTTKKNEPIQQVSVTLIKGRYKLHYYAGYAGMNEKEVTQLFDVEADPEELRDLAAAQKDVADEMLREVKAKIEKVNAPYL